MTAAQRLSSVEDYEALLEKYDTWLFDCDGVLWHGSRPVEGALEVLQLLRLRSQSKIFPNNFFADLETLFVLNVLSICYDLTMFPHNIATQQEKSVIFVTNNATQSRASYKKKFDKLGLEAHVDEIFGSAFASAVYISSVIKLPKDKKVFVIGMAGLEEELANEGISYIGGTNPEDNTLEPFDFSKFTPDPSVGAVLCGLDTSINYTKLSKAFLHLQQNPSCLFLATNEDSTYPAAGCLLPGAGAISAPLRFALGKDPVSIGKPARTMLDCIKAKHDFDPNRTIMVGDRLNTDILFGKQGMLSTLLVLTGITQESDISGPNASPIVPDFVIQSIGDLRVLDK